MKVCFSIRLPRSILHDLRLASTRSGIPMTTLIERALAEYLPNIKEKLSDDEGGPQYDLFGVDIHLP